MLTIFGGGRMRKIKFRAWDKTMNMMIYQDDTEFEFRLTGKGIEVDDLTFVDTAFNEKHEDIDCEVMQYTGLKDKNGKEIYAGDICRWRDLETFNDEILEDIFVVVWNDEKLGWYTQNEDGNFVYELYEYTDDRDLEVIGNIYENADLLEVVE